MAAVVLKARNRHYRRVEAEENGTTTATASRMSSKPADGATDGRGRGRGAAQAAWLRASSAATQEIMAHFTRAA